MATYDFGAVPDDEFRDPDADLFAEVMAENPELHTEQPPSSSSYYDTMDDPDHAPVVPVLLAEPDDFVAASEVGHFPRPPKMSLPAPPVEEEYDVDQRSMAGEEVGEHDVIEKDDSETPTRAPGKCLKFCSTILCCWCCGLSPWFLSRVLRSIPFWSNNIVTGVSVSVLGPTMLLLSENVGSNHTSWIFAAKSAGKGIGVLISGCLYDMLGEKIQRKVFAKPKPSEDEDLDDDDLVVEKKKKDKRKNLLLRTLLGIQFYQGICLVLLAVSFLVQPWVTNVWALIAVNTIGGLIAGFLEPGNTVALKWIWGLRNLDLPVQLLYFCTGFGLFVFPSLVIGARAQAVSMGRFYELVAAYVLCAMLCLIPLPLYIVCPSPILPIEEESREWEERKVAADEKVEKRLEQREKEEREAVEDSDEGEEAGEKKEGEDGEKKEEEGKNCCCACLGCFCRAYNPRLPSEPVGGCVVSRTLPSSILRRRSAQ